MNTNKSNFITIKNASRILEKFAAIEEKDYTSSQRENVIIAIDILEMFADKNYNPLISKDKKK